jgi:hypothetical protein
MNAQEIACQQAFAAGDVAYYNGAACSQSEATDSLIAQTRKALNTKTVLLVTGGVILTGLIIYLSVKK